MYKTVPSLIIFLFTLYACDLCETPLEITLRPDGAHGKDATLWSCMPDANFGNDPDYEAMAWTWRSLGFDDGVLRGVMEFDLSSIPAGSLVQSARLSLYNNPHSSEYNGEHASLSGSNLAVLRRIIEPWEEDLVTWNNQPGSTHENEIYLRESIDPHEDYRYINVTRLVQDMIDHPEESFGFLFKLQREMFYRSMIFASSDHPDPELRPILEVFYSTH